MKTLPFRVLLCAFPFLTGGLCSQAQPQLLSNIAIGIRPSDPQLYVEYKNRLWFAASLTGTRSDNALFRTDGTPAGTQLFLAPINSGDTDVENIVVSGGRLWFIRHALPSTQRRLHVSDGTTAGTRVVDPLTTLGTGMPSKVIPLRDGVVFVDRYQLRHGLYFTDGTNVTLLAAEVDQLSPFKASNRVFFGFDSVNAASHQLWSTDGTPQGTGLVADIGTPAWSAHVANGSEWQGRAYFQANDPSGPQVFVSDGTLPGTIALTAAPGGVSAQGMVAAGPFLFFRGPGGIWRTDGTPAGTQHVPGATEIYQVDANSLVAKDGLLWFVGRNAAYGCELWRSDGTQVGTYRVTDLNPGPGNGIVEYVSHVLRNLRPVGSRHLYFVGNDGVAGFALWRTDGTVPGTTMVAECEAGPGHDSFSSFAVNYVGGRLVWTGGSSTSGTEPWAMSMTGVRHPRGQGCGTPTRKPVHTSTDPRIGTTIGLDGASGYAGALGIMGLGFAAAVPNQASPNCAIQVDLATMALLPFFQVGAAGTWSVPLTIPNNAAFTGMFVMSQAFFAFTDAPTGLELSNALELVLGQ